MTTKPRLWWGLWVVLAAAAVAAPLAVLGGDSLAPLAVAAAGAAAAALVGGVVGLLGPGLLRPHRVDDRLELEFAAPILLDAADDEVVGVDSGTTDYRFLDSQLARLSSVASPPHRADHRGPDDARVVLVTSASDGARNARSLVAAELASATADAGARVLLVDADTDAQALGGLFPVVAGPGLTDTAVAPSRRADGSFDLRPFLQTSGRPGLDVMGGGRAAGSSGSTRRFDPELFAAARRSHELIVILGPPTSAGAAFVELLDHVDQVLVAVDRAARAAESRAFARLSDTMGVPLAGLVVVASGAEPVRSWLARLVPTRHPVRYS